MPLGATFFERQTCRTNPRFLPIGKFTDRRPGLFVIRNNGFIDTGRNNIALNAVRVRLSSRQAPYSFPKSALWLNGLKAELLGFPNVKHDDQVDSVTQALNWIARHRQNQSMEGNARTWLTTILPRTAHTSSSGKIRRCCVDRLNPPPIRDIVLLANVSRPWLCQPLRCGQPAGAGRCRARRRAGRRARP